MKRFLLSSALLLAVGPAAFAFENDTLIQVPPMTNALIQIDDPVFINNGSFNVAFPQVSAGMSTYYETSVTLNYTNNGTMVGSAGFDFETFPAAFGKAHLANSFANNANGLGGGSITAVGLFAGLNAFALGGSSFPLNFDIVGLPLVRVYATNIVNTGLITMDNTGLIDMLGNSLDLRRGQLIMSGGLSFSNSTVGISSLDAGSGTFGTNSGGWNPSTDLTQNFQLSPIFTNVQGFAEQMLIAGTPYFQNTAPQPDATGVAVWRIVFLQDFSAPGVTASVFFDASDAGGGAFHIQWAGPYRDARTGQIKTNYFALSDVPVIRRNTNTFGIFGGIPADFSFAQGGAPLVAGTPVVPSYVPDPFVPTAVTNDFSYVNVRPTAVLVDTNQVVGGSPTNLPGRIQLSSSNSLSLADAIISGENYLSIKAPVNFLGNSNSAIAAPYADLDLGVTNGSLNISNLLIPNIPTWTGVVGAPNAVAGIAPNGGIQAFSGSYLFVSTNIIAGVTNVVTNDVRVLMVNSALQPTTPGLENDININARDSLTINDQLTVIGQFTSDTASLTIATNANSAYSLVGALLLQDPNYSWSSSWPNLQYLTNWGIITTTNLANFADNMPTLFSPRSQAVPYQAFVNHGLISNQGIFVDANYFENDGTMLETGTSVLLFGSSGASAGIDIRANTAIITNSFMDTDNGPASFAASSIFVSNSVVSAGRTLSFNPTCFLSDGYALTNLFGHSTNGGLPNIVTNGNTFLAGGGVQILSAPGSGDLLGTTITNICLNSLESFNKWPGQDRGASPAGFADNLALGRMIFNSDGNPSHFTFVTTTGNNALYVDSLEFQNNTTNTDNNGNYTAFTIQPGMKIYFAQALMNGVSIAEKLNGKNGGGFMWVSNYAGVYSSTNLNGKLYNEALAISTHIDSDGDTIVNANDPTPFPPGWTFDISNPGPIACDSNNNNTNNNNSTNNLTGGGQNTLGILAFPAQQSGSASLSFALAQGSYNGLFYETNGVRPSSAGFFSAKLTGKGTFSGKLQLGAGTYSFSKAFNQAGNCTTLITGKGLTPLTLTLHLVNNDEITGEVSSGSNWTAELLAFSEVKNASTFGLGKHSLVLSANAGNSTPSGDSFGTMTLSKNGDIQWTGALPDGGKAGQKSALSKDGFWPLYSSLNSGNSSLIGWLQVTNGTSDIGGSAIWVVPAGQDALYPNGLTNELNAAGSDVTPSAGISQKTLILSGPGVSAPLTNSVTISGKSGQSGNNTLNLSVDVKNGLFSGSLLDPGSSQTLLFQGALLEKSGTGGGFFLNATKDQGGKVSLTPAN